MLILNRYPGETIVIGDQLINVVVLGMDGYQVKIGIDAPRDISIHRQEIYEKIQSEKKLSGG